MYSIKVKAILGYAMLPLSTILEYLAPFGKTISRYPDTSGYFIIVPSLNMLKKDLIKKSSILIINTTPLELQTINKAMPLDFTYTDTILYKRVSKQVTLNVLKKACLSDTQVYKVVKQNDMLCYLARSAVVDDTLNLWLAVTNRCPIKKRNKITKLLIDFIFNGGPALTIDSLVAICGEELASQIATFVMRFADTGDLYKAVILNKGEPVPNTLDTYFISYLVEKGNI